MLKFLGDALVRVILLPFFLIELAMIVFTAGALGVMAGYVTGFVFGACGLPPEGGLFWAVGTFVLVLVMMVRERYFR